MNFDKYNYYKCIFYSDKYHIQSLTQNMCVATVTFPDSIFFISFLNTAKKYGELNIFIIQLELNLEVVKNLTK